MFTKEIGSFGVGDPLRFVLLVESNCPELQGIHLSQEISGNLMDAFTSTIPANVVYPPPVRYCTVVIPPRVLRKLACLLLAEWVAGNFPGGGRFRYYSRVRKWQRMFIGDFCRLATNAGKPHTSIGCCLVSPHITWIPRGTCWFSTRALVKPQGTPPGHLVVDKAVPRMSFLPRQMPANDRPRTRYLNVQVPLGSGRSVQETYIEFNKPAQKRSSPIICMP